MNRICQLWRKKLDQPFQIRALAGQGRGRFRSAKLKLERLAEHGNMDEMDDLFGDEQGQTRSAALSMNCRPAQFYKSIADARWPGGPGTATEIPLGPGSRPRPQPGSRVLFMHRKALPGLLATASITNATKDLVAAQPLSPIMICCFPHAGPSCCPELDNCLHRSDEAHHLPLRLWTSLPARWDLSRLGWIDKLASRALRVNRRSPKSEELALTCPSMRVSCASRCGELARLVMEHYGETLRSQKTWASQVRALPEMLLEIAASLWDRLRTMLTAFWMRLRAVSRLAVPKSRTTEAQRLSAVLPGRRLRRPGSHLSAPRSCCCGIARRWRRQDGAPAQSGSRWRWTAASSWRGQAIQRPAPCLRQHQVGRCAVRC